MQFGVATRLLGRGAPTGLPRNAHLSLGLIWLQEASRYLLARSIYCYRIPMFLVGSDQATGRQMIKECQELIGMVSQELDERIRFTAHLPPGLGPATEASNQLEHWAVLLANQVALLQALGGPHAVVVSHMGGIAGGRRVALERAARLILRLPRELRLALAIENDEDSYDLHELLWLHAACGVPIVLDTLHQQLNNPDRIPLDSALKLAHASWPIRTRPKIHLSSQRTEAHILPSTGGGAMRVVPPRAGQHADFINPFEAMRVLEAAHGLPPFDIMIEAKAGDLAFLRLQEDLQRYAPELIIGGRK
jgi:UV DNA damage endonuclease